jgi:hypothetical protein
MRKDLKLYVIGLRRCAELRVGKKPPVPHTTSFSKIVPVTKLVQQPIGEFGTQYVAQTRRRKFTFKQTTWTGGRVLGPISANSLAYLGIYVNRDAVKEVPARHVDRLLAIVEGRQAEVQQ